MDEVTVEIIKFNNDREWDQFHSAENLAKSIAIEAGELLECFQWGGDFREEDVKMELADVLTYCVLLAEKLGVKPEAVMRQKLMISEQKYPVERSRGRSNKYTELTE